MKNIRIIIERSSPTGEYKKYYSTPEEIQRNRQENEAQRVRDEIARAEALRNENSSANRNANGIVAPD